VGDPIPTVPEVNVVQCLPPDPKVGIGRWQQIRHVRVDTTGGAIPTEREMQTIAYEAKMAYARCICKRKRPSPEAK
jgi:hypothetical protein